MLRQPYALLSKLVVFFFRADLFFFHLISALFHKMYSSDLLAAAVCSHMFPALAALAVAV